MDFECGPTEVRGGQKKINTPAGRAHSEAQGGQS